MVKANIPCIGIASNEEARVAREKSFTGRLMRVRAATPVEVEQALPYKMEELIGSLVSAQGIADIAQRHQTTIPVHIALNSAGMSRNGIELHLADGKQDALAMLKLKGITPVGIMTHFPVEEERGRQDGAGPVQTGLPVAAGSGQAGSQQDHHPCRQLFRPLEVPDAYFDTVRPGCLFYGDSIPSYTEYKRVMAFKTQVASVNHYAAGNSVGYDRTFTLKRDSWLANLPLGYSDGYCRALSNKAYVLIQGQKVRWSARPP